MPSANISWPKNVIWSCRKWHLDGFSLSPCSRTGQRPLADGEGALPQYGEDYHVIQVDQGICQVELSEAVLHKPLECRRGVAEPVQHLRNSYTPILPTVKAVYCWESLAILDLPEARFQVIVEKNRAPTMDSTVSCIRGRG